MSGKVKEVQDYLREQSIKASETAIVDAAIGIAMRVEANAVFVSEFKRRNDR